MLPPDRDFAVLEFLHTPLDPADPVAKPRVRVAVLKVRDLLDRILRDEASGAGAGDHDLASLARLLARAGSARGIVPTVSGYGWGWRRDPGEVTRRCFRAVWSVAQLLTSDDRHRLKCCDGCGALFLDRSRNRSRRWCAMELCGNRERVRAFRRRGGA